ncbi:MAG: hypothetical protein COV76_05410 [Candidatus Omnitrophica bacterium CG11_big_fil_rev_8_21_14_0_20_64_10]|nr:MAG: hypothetical protein COV76_05410 [Candidatus Omnitrophica bacterium CG11_big_fil_rev_8_21_14_0_20_64_10]
MKLFTWIIMGCYMVLFTALGAGLVAFALNWVPMERVFAWLQTAYLDENLRITLGFTGAGLVLLNWLVLELTLSKLQRQKTIAFENPDGHVTVSLSAIEDFVRRSTHEIPEVRDLRSSVVARKGKIQVRARVSLWSGANIPEVTEQVQATIRSRVQRMLAGIEDPVLIRVHVSKIVQREVKRQKPTEPAGPGQPPLTTPFYGS